MTNATPSPDFLPTASLGALQFRAQCLRETRAYFDSQGYWEVDCPLLSRDIVLDAYLEPLIVPSGHQGQDCYLQTSPEAAMKRLLAAGATAIYQLGHVFRQGERGPRHNPEFTMLEWYRVGDDYLAQMRFVEDFVRHLGQRLGGLPLRAACTPAFRRTTYREAFLRTLGLDLATASTSKLHQTTLEQQISPPATLAPEDRDGWLNLLLAFCVEPTLGTTGPEFLYDYPSSQSALARVRPGDFPVAERFELYLHGVELCNGYHELLDPVELRRRNESQSHIREREGARALPRESRLLAAMEYGIPPCSGVALGFDRLVMLLLGETEISQVIPFPIERA